MKHRTSLFDADILAYRFGNSGVVDLDFGDGDRAILVDPDQAVQDALDHVYQVTEDCGCDNIILCWSDPGEWENFRLDVDCTYKWKRPGHAGRPANYHAVRNTLSDRLTSIWRPRLEADDVMSILQTSPPGTVVRDKVLQGGETVIISVDKDLQQIPGYHYNPVTQRRTTVEAIDGDHFHMVQTLMGDAVDNYDGIPGIGIKKAEKILEPAGLDPVLEWELVVRAYIESNQFHDSYTLNGVDSAPFLAALNQARLARMLRWSDYDMQKKEPILWRPPKT